jgi:hypothetical protein
MNDAPWITNHSRPMVWKRFSYADESTWPNFGEVVLWADEIGSLGIAYLEECSHDVLIWLGPYCSDLWSDDDSEQAEGKPVVYLNGPRAWMPLPRPPITILEDEADSEITARSADIMDDLEPVLRRVIAEHLTRELPK